jgi:hypothetical protein
MDYFVVVSTLILIGLASWQVKIMKRQQSPTALENQSAQKFRYLKYWPIGVMFVIMFLNWIPYYLNSMPTSGQWEKYKGSLELIRNKTFTNQELELDGKDIENCTLINTTLIYRGKRPFILMNDIMNLSHHPVEVKIVDGPAMTGAAMVGGLITELCNEYAKEGTPCPALPVNLHGVDEQLNMH